MGILKGLQLEKKLKEIYNGLQLYSKKQERFGFLDEEEILQREDWLVEFRILQDEIRDYTMDEHLFELLHNEETRDLESKIRKIVPAWNGGSIVRLEEFEDILDISLQMTRDDLIELSISLIDLHRNMMINFSEFCKDEENLDHIKDLAVLVVGHTGGTVMDVVRYIDERYREFAEIFAIELFEIRVMFK